MVEPVTDPHSNPTVELCSQFTVRRYLANDGEFPISLTNASNYASNTIYIANMSAEYGRIKLSRIERPLSDLIELVV